MSLAIAIPRQLVQRGAVLVALPSVPDVDVTITAQGVDTLNQAALLHSEHYGPAHDVRFEAEVHEQFRCIGGFHVYHGACCPGRVDAFVLPRTIRLGYVR